MSDIDWSKAPTWANRHGFPGSIAAACWIGDEFYTYVDDPEGRIFLFREGFLLHEFSNVTVRKWNGRGLPPVGTVCEARHEEINGGYPVKAEILKHHENGKDAAFFWIDAPEDEPNLLWARFFSPILTHEPTAAEQRTIAINELCTKIAVFIGDRNLNESLGKYLYNCGYRKGKGEKA